MIITTKMETIGLAVDANGMTYTLREAVQYNKETGEEVPHYDGAREWYSISKMTANGMPAGLLSYGPDLEKAKRYLRRKAVNNNYHLPA